MKSIYFDKDGKPLKNTLEWCKLFEDFNYKRVARFWTPWIWVSTVWLGLDHNFGRGRPKIFETMVFLTPTFEELYCNRYSTLAEAKAGHKEAVKKFMFRIDLMLLDIFKLLYSPSYQWKRKIMIRKIFLKRKYWYSSMFNSAFTLLRKGKK